MKCPSCGSINVEYFKIEYLDFRCRSCGFKAEGLGLEAVGEAALGALVGYFIGAFIGRLLDAFLKNNNPYLGEALAKIGGIVGGLVILNSA